MKKILAILLIAVLAASSGMIAAAYTAFDASYPASQKEFGMAAPADGALMIGEVVGGEESLLGGWSNTGERNPDTAAHAAFTGLTDRDEPGAFFDPQNAGDPSDWCGLKMPEAYILTEIRLLPRDDQLGRHRGAAIWGFNGGAFDPATATLIFEADWGADEYAFQVYKPADFIPGANTGFTHFAYFNEQDHGDIMVIELYGSPAAAPATDGGSAASNDGADAAASDAAAEPDAPAPAPSQTAAAPAPRTGDMRIIIALSVLVATAFVTIKLTKQKNRA